METTFMTIHNDSPEANILYATESIVDVLGYEKHEVVGKSCFDYFHPDEVLFARGVHSRGVMQDKAAVIHYARIQARNGDWISCECVFTVVYNVLVACTSIYKQDERSIKRRAEAPNVQRLFSSPPRDPRYHMLDHLSVKFEASPEPATREPRAALVLNRFSRTLTILYATESVVAILGLPFEEIENKSFYECIHEDCLPDAIRCLESAKANDSIAYLRFWYRDPRRHNEGSPMSSDEEDGGVEIDRDHLNDTVPALVSGRPSPQNILSSGPQTSPLTLEQGNSTSTSRSTNVQSTSDHNMFDRGTANQSRSSSSSVQPFSRPRVRVNTIESSPRSASPLEPFEVEAVVSCTSDGLVVILRRAHPRNPEPEPQPGQAPHSGGIFAAPWGANPIIPSQFEPEPSNAASPSQLSHIQAPGAHAAASNGPCMQGFMNSIREIAVFAWSLTGIHGKIAGYARGTPQGEAIPPTGFPIWNSQAPQTPYQPPENQAYYKWEQLYSRPALPQTAIAPPIFGFQHQRQENHIRQQFGGPMTWQGSDAPGSRARQHLGRYIGEDGRGAGYFQHVQYPQYHQNNVANGNGTAYGNPRGYGFARGNGDREDVQMGDYGSSSSSQMANTRSGGPPDQSPYGGYGSEDGNGSGNGNGNGTGDRFLWY